MNRDKRRRTSRCSRCTCTTSGASRPSGNRGGANAIERMGTRLRHSLIRSPRFRGRARRSSNVSCQPGSLAKAGSVGSRLNVVTSPIVSARAFASEVPARAKAAPTTRCRSSARTPTRSARVLERVLQLLLFFEQPFVARFLLVIHFRASAGEPFGVGLVFNCFGECFRLAAVDAVCCKSIGDALLYDLTGGTELFPDYLGLAYQRLVHDVGLALLVAKIAAEHLLGRLKLAVDAAVALLEPRWIARQIEMDEIRAISLQGDAFPGGIGADQDAQRLLLRICVEGGLHLLAAILPGGSGKDANALVCSVSVGKRFSQAPFQPTTGVLPFREDNEPAIIPVGAG